MAMFYFKVKENSGAEWIYIFSTKKEAHKYSERFTKSGMNFTVIRTANHISMKDGEAFVDGIIL